MITFHKRILLLFQGFLFLFFLESERVVSAGGLPSTGVHRLIVLPRYPFREMNTEAKKTYQWTEA
jgi:hypothetical protein